MFLFVCFDGVSVLLVEETGGPRENNMLDCSLYCICYRHFNKK
jgi:hypothetical protein